MEIDIPEAVSLARKEFQDGKTRDVEFRRRMLQNLLRFYEEEKELICKVIYSDLKKHSFEVIVTEIAFLVADCKTMLNNLDQWTSPISVRRSLATLCDRPHLLPEPYGVVAVLGAWNYPLQLVLGPVAGAIAAGNCVIIKPSDLAPCTARLLGSSLGRYLDPGCFPVVLGDAELCSLLLQQQLDYIFYTGGERVARLVHSAANRHLTPVVLELGGKSPVFVDCSADLEVAVKRVMWGKCLNAGQTCVAPDYLLCEGRELRDRFVDAARRVLFEWFGGTAQHSSSLGRIVNEKHFQRVQALLEPPCGTVALGGGSDAADLFVEPTILVDVPSDCRVMQEEIFAPILPIIVVESCDHAVRFINNRPSPLAFYVFSKKQKVVDKMTKEIRAGGITVNDVVLHLSVEELPFGGVGASGMGRYHGKYTFDTFTHYKSVLQRSFSPLIERLCSVRYPPYTEQSIERAKMLLKNPRFPSCCALKMAAVFSVGFTSAYVLALLSKKFNFEDYMPGF